MKAVCIDFICPNCSGIYEIFMRRTPQLMSFDCPSCKESLTIYDGIVQIFDASIIEKIKNVKDGFDAENLCSDIDEKIKLQNRSVITRDEILDFSIELYKCESFDDIMNLLCKS